MLIAVTEPFLPETHSQERCYDFLGLILEADGDQLKAVRKACPDIRAKNPNMYEVVLTHALKALADAQRTQAVIYWENVGRIHFIEIPHRCATVIRG